ncbi:MAG: glucose-6-phosphate isomerase [Desulfovibrionaceae bacterium]
MADYLDWTGAAGAGIDVDAQLANSGRVLERLRADLTAGELPFLAMPYMDGLLAELEGLRGFVRGFEHMLVLGIGGSALGARALQRAFAPGQDLPGHAGPWLWILDNVDAPTLTAYLDRLPPEKTLVVVISKSGGTIETIGQYFLVRAWLRERLGGDCAGHLFFVTDAHKGFLREEADGLGVRTLPVPDFLGGRYSALSAVGLLPALFLGLDVRALTDGARAAAAALLDPGLTAEALAATPAFRLAAWNAALMAAGHTELIFFCYVPAWATFGAWFAQLWAESLGKHGKGSMPIPATGVTDQHSVNQMFLDGPRNKACLFITQAAETPLPFPPALPGKWAWLNGGDFGRLIQAEGLGTRMALSSSGVPLVELRMDRADERAAGKMMVLLGAATLMCGWLLGINPVDQPAVELGKRLANARLGAPGLEREKADLAAFLNLKRNMQEL